MGFERKNSNTAECNTKSPARKPETIAGAEKS
jgi:hypothetical protein